MVAKGVHGSAPLYCPPIPQQPVSTMVKPAEKGKVGVTLSRAIKNFRIWVG
jgi:hypothetical protein